MADLLLSKLYDINDIRAIDENIEDLITTVAARYNVEVSSSIYYTCPL